MIGTVLCLLIHRLLFFLLPIPMRITSLSVFFSLFLVACTSIDTTGITSDSTKVPKGNPSASIVVTEFADIQCPACKGAHALITLPLLQKYGSKIRFDYKHFPLRSIHPYALKAAQATECAADQGKFWEYLAHSYEHQEELSKSPYEDWAKALSLDTGLFHRCLESGIKEKAVLADVEQGTSLKVNSTPSFFVNGVRIVTNNLAEFDAAIEAATTAVESVPL